MYFVDTARLRLRQFYAKDLGIGDLMRLIRPDNQRSTALAKRLRATWRSRIELLRGPTLSIDTRSICLGPEFPSRAESQAALARSACVLQRTESPPELVYPGSGFGLQGSGSGNAVGFAWR